MSRPPFTVTPDLRAKVRSLAGVGVPQDDIAILIGCSAKTLRKHFRSELDLGAAEAMAVVVGQLRKLISAGSVGVLIFWQKSQGGTWNAGEVAISAASEEQPPAVYVIMPDNQRDPARTEWAIGVWNEAEALLRKKAARKESEARRYRAGRAKVKNNGSDEGEDS